MKVEMYPTKRGRDREDNDISVKGRQRVTSREGAVTNKRRSRGWEGSRRGEILRTRYYENATMKRITSYTTLKIAIGKKCVI